MLIAVVDLANPLFCFDNLGLSVSPFTPGLLPLLLRYRLLSVHRSGGMK